MQHTPAELALAKMRNDFGADRVLTHADECAFFSQDVFAQARPCLAVLQPTTIEELAEMLVCAHAANFIVIARGGGLSYTDAYLPVAENSLIVDLRALDRIEEINAEDAYVVVQAGVTWASLHEMLKKQGLRTPFWGPLSGLLATVGGALSQGSTFLGSGRYGSVGDTVLGMELLQVDGTCLRTGSWAAGANALPFARYFGPDLTGLFVGDAGSLAIKVRASLRVIPAHPHIDFLSFSCDHFASMRAAMSEVARLGIASECFGFDAVLTQKRMQRASLASDVKTLSQVLKSQGMLEGLRVIAAGRNFFDASKPSFHLCVEADSVAELQARLAAARRACAMSGVIEIENSIPKVMRSQSFAPPNSMLGPHGERWVPVHGVLAHSQSDGAFAALQGLFLDHAESMASLQIEVGFLYTTVGAQGFLIEPVFYWPDSQTPYHQRMVEPQHRARLNTFPDNPAARSKVAELRKAAAACLRAQGASHFQLGKFYDYRGGRDAAQLALLDAIKQQLDPQARLNPGALAGP